MNPVDPAQPVQSAAPPPPGYRPEGAAADRPPVRLYTRQQQTTIIYGILSIVLLILILQLWLLIATMNAYLGGDQSVIWPAAAVSVVCLLLNLGLLRYVYETQHR